MLKRMGYETKVVSNGKIALEAIAEESFPLILMDAQMPVMDGLTTTKWIRENIAPEKQPKIVVMTASMMEDAKQMWKTTRVDGYIEKPVRLEVLHRSIDEILSGTSDLGGIAH